MAIDITEGYARTGRLARKWRELLAASRGNLDVAEAALDTLLLRATADPDQFASPEFHDEVRHFALSWIQSHPAVLGCLDLEQNHEETAEARLLAFLNPPKGE